ncbi:hypothetical protein V7S43_010578 [Phytophthora oleae]|uniref:Uncharacterized protein n=1 Tax=Phytophthora oleae TaxID=2107226 RepID=A0ABD3FEB0_9STRA
MAPCRVMRRELEAFLRRMNGDERERLMREHRKYMNSVTQSTEMRRRSGLQTSRPLSVTSSHQHRHHREQHRQHQCRLFQGPQAYNRLLFLDVTFTSSTTRLRQEP